MRKEVQLNDHLKSAIKLLVLVVLLGVGRNWRQFSCPLNGQRCKPWTISLPEATYTGRLAITNPRYAASLRTLADSVACNSIMTSWVWLTQLSLSTSWEVLRYETAAPTTRNANRTRKEASIVWAAPLSAICNLLCTCCNYLRLVRLLTGNRSYQRLSLAKDMLGTPDT
jgi:hypothetical protein